MQTVLLMIGRIKQEGERDLEGLGHLEGIQLQFKRRLHQGQHRRDGKTGTGSVFRQIAKRFDMTTGQPDFLFRLAQGGMERTQVLRLDASTGKTAAPKSSEIPSGSSPFRRHSSRTLLITSTTPSAFVPGSRSRNSSPP